MFLSSKSTRTAALALGLAAVTAFTAGCASGSSAETGGAAAGGEITETGQQIRDLLGIADDDPNTGAGETWNLGAILAMSGYGSFYGINESAGLDVAVKQIAEAGGPTINIDYKDNQSGDATAGVTALRTLAADGVPLVFLDYIGNSGSLFQPLESYQILGIDGGGGTGGFGRSMPYFYGPRSETPADAIPGLLEYIKAAMPEVKSIAMTAADFGDSNQDYIDTYTGLIEDAGLEMAGYEVVAGGTTDYSTVISRLLDYQPDLIIPSLYGTDAGLFAKQYAATGSEVPTIGTDFNSDALEAGGAAYDGFTFAAEYFDAADPSNELAAIGAAAFEAENGTPMNSFNANFYEDAFLAWQLYRDVKAAGGDVNSSADLLAALEANPEFPSVYGGSGSTLGALGLDLDTHSVSSRAMGVYEWDGEKVVTKATFDIGGADFQLAE